MAHIDPLALRGLACPLTVTRRVGGDDTGMISHGPDLILTIKR